MIEKQPENNGGKQVMNVRVRRGMFGRLVLQVRDWKMSYGNKEWFWRDAKVTDLTPMFVAKKEKWEA